MSSRPRPPIWAATLVRLVAPARDRDEILGDLEEEFGTRHEDQGQRRAQLWYLSQVSLFFLRLPVQYSRDAASRLSRRLVSDPEPHNVGGAKSSAPAGGIGWALELRRAVRSLWRQRGFTAVAVVTLALGIGANTAIFSMIDGVLLRPLPYFDPDGIVQLSDGHDDFGGTGLDQSLPNLLDLIRESQLLAGTAIYRADNGNLATVDRPERVRILRTSHEMLSVLGVVPRLGRDLLPENDVAGSAAVAILSDGLWRSRFGADPGIIGRSVTLDMAPLEIVGVLPPGFSFPGDPELLAPIQHIGTQFMRGARYFNAIGRLADGVGIGPLREELEAIFSGIVEEYPGPNEGWHTWADPMKAFVLGDSGRSLALFAGAVGLVLLMACVNVANLLIVRAEGRRGEFAVRYALGAGRSGLIPLFLSEGIVLACLGGGAGILTAVWGMEVLVNTFGEAIPRADLIELSNTTLLVGVAASVLVGVIVGLVPLLRVRSDDLLRHLRSGGRGSRPASTKLGQSLVMVEVILAVLLVSGAGLLTRSVSNIRQIDLGLLDPEGVLTFRVSLPPAAYEEPSDIMRFHDDLLEELRRLPGSGPVATVNRLPLVGGYSTTRFTSVADPDRSARFVSIRIVSADYFDVTGVSLVAGEWLPLTGGGVILVNETLARQLFPNEEAVGQMVGPDYVEGGLRIVGVIEDIMGDSPTDPAPPAFYYPFRRDPLREFSVMVRSSAEDPYGLLTEIRSAVARVDPGIPIYAIRTLSEIADSRLGDRRVAVLLFSVFSMLALGLGAVGIYGVMSYAVAQRSGEIGVRLALGASRGSVFRLVLAHGARITIPAVAIGVVLSAVSGRVLGGLLYEVKPLDPLTYVAVATTLAVVAGLACWLPAYRATRVDPLASFGSP